MRGIAHQHALPAGPEAALLLQSIAEQLKLPLTNLARQVELGELQGGAALDLTAMRTQTAAALTLVESYLLGLQLAREQGQLSLEPVSVASTLTETAHDLRALAKHCGVELEVSIAGRYEPVMAHRSGLRAALLSLGYTLVESLGAQSRNRRLVLAVHRTQHGIVAGLYGGQEQLRPAQWRRALELCGKARQPYVGLTANSGAGLFVADSILQAMSARLRVGRHHKQSGLSVTLAPSRQLQLV